MHNHDRMTEMYRNGNMPWDAELPPPEVISTVADLAPARALDLGCGPGRTARYLARAGWQVDAVDFVAEAIEIAQARSAEFKTIRYHTASVTELDFLTPPYSLAIDVGCAHALNAAQLAAYHQQLLRLLAPSATFLLFGGYITESEDASDQSGSGFDRKALESLFANGFTQTACIVGETNMPDATWHSAWWWFQRS